MSEKKVLLAVVAKIAESGGLEAPEASVAEGKIGVNGIEYIKVYSL